MTAKSTKEYRVVTRAKRFDGGELVTEARDLAQAEKFAETEREDFPFAEVVIESREVTEWRPDGS